MRAASRIGILWILVSFCASGCHKAHNQLLATPSPPDSLLKCVQLELAKAKYVTIGADRASGWLRAQRRKSQIYVTVIPDDSGSGSHIQLTNKRGRPGP